MASKHSNKGFRVNDRDTDSDSDHSSDFNSNWPRFLAVESSQQRLFTEQTDAFAFQKGFEEIAWTLNQKTEGRIISS